MGEFKKRKAACARRLDEQRKHDLRANAEMNREAGVNLPKLFVIYKVTFFSGPSLQKR